MDKITDIDHGNLEAYVELRSSEYVCPEDWSVRDDYSFILVQLLTISHRGISYQDNILSVLLTRILIYMGNSTKLECPVLSLYVKVKTEDGKVPEEKAREDWVYQEC